MGKPVNIRKKPRKIVEFGPETAAIEQAFEVVQAQIHKLRGLITGLDRDLHAVVYTLTEAPDGRVDVSEKSGAAARRVAAEMIADISIPEDIRRTRRLPGLLAASPTTLKAIETLNAAKVEFADLVAALPKGTDGERRAAILNRVCPQMHLGHISRTVVTLPKAPDWASFVWVRGGTGNTFMDREKVLKMLDRHEKYHCRHQTDPASCEAMVAMARKIIAREPPKQSYVQARPVAPHLRVNLRTGKARLQRHAYLPVFYPRAPATPESFSPGAFLPVTDPETTARARAPRSDCKREAEPLVHGLHIYRRIVAKPGGA